MPVNTKYKGYDKAIKKVERVRDFNEGEDAVKDAGKLYLPRLGAQTNGEYDSYKMRGVLVPAVSPTAVAVTGAIMRRPAVLTPSIETFESDVDGDSTTINEFTSRMIKELLLAGGAAYLVEYDESQSKPIVKQYTKENVINIHSSFVVLRQFYTETDPKDKFNVITKEEYIELTFDEEGSYIQNVWRQKGAGSNGEFAIVETVKPTIRGTALNYLPIVYTASGESFIGDSDPILLNLTNVNWDQYRLSTDLRHGQHFAALPTLNAFGDMVDENGVRKQLTVGPGRVNIIPDTDARIEVTEVSGAGFASLVQSINEDIEVMASIGAKMLTSESGGVKAAETARIDASSETATLSTIANKVDMAMADLLSIMAEWGAWPDAEYKINRDFIDVKMDAAQMTALLKVYQSGGMSLMSFLYQLQKGELLPPGVGPEDEAGRIETTGVDFEV